MKKIFLVIIQAALIAGGAFGQNGVIREMVGTVELKAAGASAFVPAVPGTAVAQNTIVSTGFKSTAIIAVGGTLITVRPLTRLTLAEISSAAGTEKLNVNLQTGRVKVDVKPPAGTKTTASVHSPIATASVRGTSFEFDSRNVKVTEGVVLFRGRTGAAIIVSAGKTGHVTINGKAVAPANAEVYLPLPPIGIESDTAVQPPSPTGTGVIETSLDYSTQQP